jgi:hypothetical protein
MESSEGRPEHPQELAVAVSEHEERQNSCDSGIGAVIGHG